MMSVLQSPHGAKQSIGVRLLGWLIILWSGFLIVQAFLTAWLVIGAAPSRSSSWLGSVLLIVISLVYLLIGIGWLDARGWAWRALVQCIIASVLAVQTGVLLDILRHGLTGVSFMWIIPEIWLIVPVGVLVSVMHPYVRGQFDPIGPMGRVGAFAAALLVYVVFGGFQFFSLLVHSILGTPHAGVR